MKKNRFLAAVMCATLVLALLPGAAMAAPATSVTIGGTVTLDATAPYYHNGTNGALGTADNISNGASASFDATQAHLRSMGITAPIFPPTAT